jgi:hypothetical protein
MASVALKGRRLRCKTCGKQFTRPVGSNRLNCSVCKPPRDRPDAAPAGPEPAEAVAPRAAGPLELAAVAELTRTERLDTVKGQIAVRLARALDDPDLSDARLSALGSQLEKTMDAATAGALPPPDKGDELSARRRMLAEGA